MKSNKYSLSHVDMNGNVCMVDISDKKTQKRIVTASGRIQLDKETIELVTSNGVAKGNVIATSKVAGIQASKKTDELIPMCHQISIEHISIDIELFDDHILVISKVISTGKTGAEMEAITSVSIALLTIYDMCKSVCKTMIISDIKVNTKEKS